MPSPTPVDPMESPDFTESLVAGLYQILLSRFYQEVADDVTAKRFHSDMQHSFDQWHAQGLIRNPVEVLAVKFKCNTHQWFDPAEPKYDEHDAHAHCPAFHVRYKRLVGYYDYQDVNLMFIPGEGMLRT